MGTWSTADRRAGRGAAATKNPPGRGLMVRQQNSLPHCQFPRNAAPEPVGGGHAGASSGASTRRGAAAGGGAARSRSTTMATAAQIQST